MRLLPSVGVRRANPCACSTFRAMRGSASGVVEKRAAGGIEFDLRGGVDDHVDTTELPPQREQFRVRVRGLSGTAAAHDDDLADVRVAQGLHSVVGHVGAGEDLRIHHQRTGDVECDVAVADDHRALTGQVERPVRVVGMPVVPGNEFRCSVRAGQVLARDLEVPVTGRADRVDDRVVVGEQFVVRDVGAHLDVEVALGVLVSDGAAEQVADRLGALVIRCHTGPDETERRREAIEDVDLDTGTGSELHRGVAGGGTGSDDRDPQGAQLGGGFFSAHGVPASPARSGNARSSPRRSSGRARVRRRARCPRRSRRPGIRPHRPPRSRCRFPDRCRAVRWLRTAVRRASGECN